MTRQFLVNQATVIYKSAMKSFDDKNRSEFLRHSSSFLDLLNDLERILSTDRHFMLGSWIEAAKKIGSNDEEKKLLEFNAKNQVPMYSQLYYKSEHHLKQIMLV
jgi:alpha-N-acetylglucosaminidase